MAAKNLTSRFCETVKPISERQVEYPDSVVRGLALRVSGDGRKAWTLRYRVRDTGDQRRLSLGTFPALDLSDARDAAVKALAAVADGKDPAGERRRARHAARAEPLKTFDDLAEAYFKASESGAWRPKNKQKRERTIHDERAVYRRHVKAALGNERLEEITRPGVRRLLREMIAKGIGAQTNRAHAMIRQAFNFAIHEERLTLNPAQGFPPMATVNAKARTLTDAELKAFWGGLQAPADLRGPDGERVYVSRAMAIALQLLSLLMLRRAEVTGMMEAELNLDEAVWIIPAERMKGGRSHTVPLPPKAVELIREALALRGNRGGPYVFPSPRDPHKPLRHDSLTHTMADVTGALGIVGATPHDLRRTGATALTSERLGISPFIRSQVLGHSSDTGGGAAVSSAHYDVNLYISEKRRALEAWEGLLLEIVGERPRGSNVRPLRAGAVA